MFANVDPGHRRALRPRGSGDSRWRLRWAAASATAIASIVLLGIAPSRGRAEVTPSCTMRTLPSFVAQGVGAAAGSVADVIEISCENYAHKELRVESSQLYARCHNQLRWLPVYETTPGPSSMGVTATTDANGNAAVVAFGGPECAAGESLVSVSMEEPPFETITASFNVLAAAATTPGITAMPSTAVGYERNSHLATIAEAEVQTRALGGHVQISSAELSARCSGGLDWLGPDGVLLASGVDSLSNVALDRFGNAFVVILDTKACVSGESILEADLEQSPFTTYTTTFTIAPPPPIVLKLKHVAGPARGGKEVTIIGANLNDVTDVRFGGASAADFIVDSSTRITAVAPPGTAGPANITVTAPSGTSEPSAASVFTYGRPTVTSISPGTGPEGGGTIVDVTGSGFAPGSGTTAFQFGKTPGTAVRCSSTTACVVTAPPGRKRVNVIAVVGALKSSGTAAGRFTYMAP